MRTPTVIDTVGLTAAELGRAVSIFGGSHARIRTLPLEQAVSFAMERRQLPESFTIIVEWGQANIIKLLWLIDLPHKIATVRLAVHIGSYLWCGEINSLSRFNQMVSYFDGIVTPEEQLPDSLEFQRYLASIPHLLLDWNDLHAALRLAFLIEEGLASIPFYGHLNGYILWPGPVISLHPLESRSKSSISPLRPLPTPPAPISRRVEQQLGWPTVRYSSPPKPQDAAKLANQILKATGMKWTHNPVALCGQLGIPIVFHSRLGRDDQAYFDVLEGKRHHPIEIHCNLSLTASIRSDFDSLPPKMHQRLWSCLMNLSIAHELAHSFFFDWGPGRWPTEIENLNPGYFISQENRERTEIFCEVFAMALLWPSSGPLERKFIRKTTGRYIRTWRKNISV